ncbi:hypothetical protein CMEL01_15236 [Colletotrichum melonis]|uniref:Uncharacterized protein n=1 Tax=Colletotrichum melonis TaxID=1209925 RepID=A0AAI9URT7_9PEZI|nr:hypothetical protein CMEL01_15236 [Colletotrichum melonis]
MLPGEVQANLFLFPPCLSADISQAFLSCMVSVVVMAAARTDNSCRS